MVRVSALHWRAPLPPPGSELRDEVRIAVDSAVELFIQDMELRQLLRVEMARRVLRARPRPHSATLSAVVAVRQVNVAANHALGGRLLWLGRA